MSLYSCVARNTYDPLYHLTSAEYRSTRLTAGSTGESFAYEYDAVDNRTVLTETTPANGTRTTHYEYDAAGAFQFRGKFVP
ncbi:MAG: hypothetical protein NUW24_13710 [Anaerolineae bacterium]|nr:hypothetical protein [Anaerolineae bacterium]MDH7475706.1 hypothetical protein [Anaerolineae bacterium]